MSHTVRVRPLDHPAYLPAPESWVSFFAALAEYRGPSPVDQMARYPWFPADVLWMRAQRRTYSEIAEMFGMSRERARQIANEAEQWARRGQGVIPRPEGLPVPPPDLDWYASGRDMSKDDSA